MRKLAVYIFLLIGLPVNAQIGGEAVYGFLETGFNFAASATATTAPALAVSHDAFLANPALADTSFAGRVTAGYYNYLTDINAGTVLYSKQYKRFVTFGAIEYFNYGKFEGYDEVGNPTGEFTASDYAFILGSSLLVDSNLTLGIAFKPVYSRMEQYFSWGIAFDLGMRFHVHNTDFTLAIRNLGRQIKPYYNTVEQLPLNISFGVSTKLRYAPFRPYLTLEHLENLDLYYSSPLDSLYTLNLTDTAQASLLTRLGRETVRHISLGTEIIFSKRVSAFVSYNLRRAEELSLPTLLGSEGLALALQIKLSKYSFGYSWQKFHVAGSSSFFYFEFDPQGIFNLKKHKNIIP